MGGLKALKSEKTEREQPSEEPDAAQAGFLERWRLPSRLHGQFRGLNEILVRIIGTAAIGFSDFQRQSPIQIRFSS